MAENNTCGNGGGCGCNQTTPATNQEKRLASQAAQRQIDVEFLYLDLNVCEQCKGAESGLEEALADISEVLKSARVAVNVKKTHIESFEQALKLNFISSPTIRINGRDVSLEVKENYCASCSELSGEDTFCRIWNFQGEEFSSVPKSLIIEAVLKEVYGSRNSNEERKPAPEQFVQSLNNLKRFFEGRKRQENGGEDKEITFEQPHFVTSPVLVTSSVSCGC